MNITLTPVESSQIAAVGYDAATRTLAIQFKKKSGPSSLYHYDNVPADVHQAFVAAESKGRFFGANIKGNADFAYRKIEPERKDEDAATEEV
jgi:hypothetical protein